MKSLKYSIGYADLADAATAGIPFAAVQNGAGQKFTQLKGLVELSLLVIATPVEADDVELRFCFTHSKVEPGSPQEMAVQAAIDAAFRLIGEMVGGVERRLFGDFEDGH
jgi:hypothetical protein